MRKRYADHYGIPVERVFIVPKNRYMKRGHALRKNRLPLHVRVVMYEILVAMLRAEPPPAGEMKRATEAEKEQFAGGDPVGATEID